MIDLKCPDCGVLLPPTYKNTVHCLSCGSKFIAGEGKKDEQSIELTVFEDEIINLLKRGSRFSAVRRVRDEKGWDLNECKSYVKELMERYETFFSPPEKEDESAELKRIYTPPEQPSDDKE